MPHPTTPFLSIAQIIFEFDFVKHILHSKNKMQTSFQSIFEVYCTIVNDKSVSFVTLDESIYGEKTPEPPTNCYKRFFNGFW